ncbi:hypothetical protein, partial [Agromyces seonyuensis]
VDAPEPVAPGPDPVAADAPATDAAAAETAPPTPPTSAAEPPADSDLDAAIGRASTLEAPPAPEPAEPPTFVEPPSFAETSTDSASADSAADAALAADSGAATAATEAVPAPVAAGAVRRETFLPPTVQDAPPVEEAGAAVAAPQTIYVQAPAAPKTLHNRGFGTLVALVATLAFAVLYLGIAALLLAGAGWETAGEYTLEFAGQARYWVPVILFFVGFVVLIVIVDRGRWWAYVVFGLLVGIWVYFAYLGGAALTIRLWEYTPQEAAYFISTRWLDPFAIISGVLAREVVIWFGAWIAARGAVVEQRNRDNAAEYERLLAAGPAARQY